jgi:peroxiredoxin Q/BCP
MATAGKTKRGVFIVDKQGKVLEAFQGGPQPTVDAAQRIVSGQGKGGVNEGGVTKKNGEEKSDKKAAETAAEVADSAAKVDA